MVEVIYHDEQVWRKKLLTSSRKCSEFFSQFNKDKVRKSTATLPCVKSQNENKEKSMRIWRHVYNVNKIVYVLLGLREHFSSRLFHEGKHQMPFSRIVNETISQRSSHDFKCAIINDTVRRIWRR